jgi:predicted nuclease of predicted toxin-antitoxin system
MKLLFDENLSHKLAWLLEDLFPNSTHVRTVGLEMSEDPLVWEYAKENGLVLVSKDADMHQRSFLFGHPPKVVWIRLGNCSTSDVEKLLRKNIAAIKAFHEDDYASFLSLSH